MNKDKELQNMKERALKDNSLPLKNTATNLVFGVGNPSAEIMFIGEGPGYWEDMKAEPFVGNAGALLNQMLNEIGIERSDVYITNVIMYRPPNNRDPEDAEINAFKPYLDGIINIIKPKVIVTLGRFSMAKFLPGVFISSVHGKIRIVDWNGGKIAVYPMYHPAAALRNGVMKEKFRQDFVKLPELIRNITVKNDQIDDKIDNNVSEGQQDTLFSLNEKQK